MEGGEKRLQQLGTTMPYYGQGGIHLGTLFSQKF